MNVPGNAVPYLVGIGLGVFAFVVSIPLLGVPSSFGVFVLRSIAIILAVSILGLVVADRRLGGSNRP